LTDQLNCKFIKQFIQKFFKYSGITIGIILILVVAILLFLRSPWGQDILVGKATSFISKKTGTIVNIERLFITFKGDLTLEGLYLEDLEGDTLIYSKLLETGISFIPLIKNGDIEVSKLEWQGVTAKVKRDSVSQNFNFNFLMEAFISAPDEQEEPVEQDQPQSFPNISLGPVDLLDFKLVYEDQVLGIETKAFWDEIRVRMDHLDLNKMDFGIQEILISAAKIDYFQSKPFITVDTVDTDASIPLPLIVLDNLRIEQTDLNYHSIPDGIKASIYLDEFGTVLPEANLEDQKILLQSIFLSNSTIALEISPTESGLDENNLQSSTEPFDWPDWWVEVGDIDFQNNDIDYKISGAKVQKGIFNPDAILLNGLDFSAQNIFLKDKSTGGKINKVAFQEGSGLSLKNLQADISADDQKLNLDSFSIKTGGTNLTGNLSLNYPSLGSLIDVPEKSTFDLQISEFSTDASEAAYFVPELKNEMYFQELVKNGLEASGRINGSLQEVLVPKFEVLYGNYASLNLDAALIENPLDINNIRFDLPSLVVETDKAVLMPFVEDLEFDLPESIKLQAAAKGGMNDLIFDLLLATSDGDVFLKGAYIEDDIYFLESNWGMREFDLGKILKMPELLPITLQSSIEGRGKDLNDIDGLMTLDIEKLTWYDFDYSPLDFKVTAKDGIANLEMDFLNDALDFDIKLTAVLDTLDQDLNLFVDLKKFHTQAFGLTNQDINTRFQITGSLEGNFDDFRASLSLDEGYFFYENKAFPMGRVVLQSEISEQLSSLQINSDFLNGLFTVNGSIANLIQSLEAYFEEVIAGSTESMISDDLVAKGNFTFQSTPFLDQLLIGGIEKLDSVSIDFEFLAAEKTLNSLISIPLFQYNSSKVESFEFSINGEENKLQFTTGFDSLSYDPINMGETELKGFYQDGILNLDFLSLKDDNPLIHIGSELFWQNDSLSLHFQPENLVLNGLRWQMPENNKVVYTSNHLAFQNFVFTSGDQLLKISNGKNGTSKEQIDIRFENFGIVTLTGFLNPNDPVLNGIVNGSFIIENPFDAIGLLADLNISEFVVLDIPLGNLDLLAEAETLNSYGLNISLSEGDIEANVVGTFVADTISSNLDLNLDLKALKFGLIEALSGSELKNSKGYLSGNIKLGGTIQDPVYSGELFFKEAEFLVSSINAKFSLPDERIQINNSGLVFNDFSIRDEAGASFVINGNLITEDISDIGFDLKLETKNFQIINSTREDNDLFFGNANVDLDMKIGGSFSLPVIDVILKVNRGTEMTLIIPEDQLDYLERTGVVLFVNHQDAYDILYKRDSEITAQGIQGFDIKANLQVDPQTVINLIIDERTNDNLRIQGQADLNMIMNPNGDISLSGRYEVKSGHYELNLFGLVSRRFLLAEGSTVIWTGNMLDANLNITAIYNVRTSPAELMQAQLSGTDTQTRSQFRQVLPFMVYLKINGEMLQPEISFELDMAEQDRGAFDGNVYSMIQQVNQREDELNKQVFSLLVLNQFFPMVGNDGSSGGSVNLARSSVSQILSSQLNTFSDRLFGNSGFSVDFDLDSYTDYQSGAAEDRTQLNVAAKQSLMDDRLVISVGGQVDVEGGNQQPGQGNAVFGDVSLEYLLDQRGRWRVKTFRKNQFESVIDGQLIITGISFIFNKEFNSFTELWKRADVEKPAPDQNKDKEEDKGKVNDNSPVAKFEEENDLKN
jgi:hypothetical protein